MNAKTCKKCGESKSWGRFSVILESGNLRGTCKDCRRPSDEEEARRGRKKWLKHGARIKECRKLQRQTWSEEQKQLQRERERQSAVRCAERVARYQQEYKKNHAAELKAKDKQYRQRTTVAIRARNIRRRTQQANTGGSYSPSEWRGLCALFDNRCLACNEVKPLTVDHVVPVVLGGSSDIINLQPLCLQCNIRKGVRIIDYRSGLQDRGRSANLA
jgi:5-methylcytosine-specific restriction endonuclease McrA